MDFPVWAWDRGHDVTLMDQQYEDKSDVSTFNINSILLKPSEFTQRFGEECFGHLKGVNSFHGDSGPYMETMLTFLGLEAKEAGRAGYDKKCMRFLKSYDMSPEQVLVLEQKYNECFFNELDRLSGTFGSRTSKNIGFSPTFLKDAAGYTILPQHLPSEPSALGPWANCWSTPRKLWSDPELNCFALRLSESEAGGKVSGKCPDLSFNWTQSEYNPVNRVPKPDTAQQIPVS